VDEHGFFARVARLVQRRPVLVAVATAAVLLVAGAPLLSLNVQLPGLSGVPRSIEAARVADELTARFGRTTTPAITVVASTDASTLDAWAARWRSDPAVTGVRPAKAAGSGKATVGIDVAGDPQGAPVRALVLRLRADRPPGGQSWVTGDVAVLVDLLNLIKSALPAAVGVTLLAMVALLFAMTGSLVVPIKAILANAVSLGATFGVLTAVFEHGFGSNLLDTLTVGSLNPFVIVIVFAFAFGLSMDYEVFLLGRIKEYVDAGVPTDAAVRRGLQHTGRVITSAALLMVIVFSCFAAARMGNIEQIGLGLTVAVLIDATIVRCLLVPATMTLLGRWNWWAPAPLRRLHTRLGLRELPLPLSAGGSDAGPEPEMADLDRVAIS
jgi:RND superfamily putative drug exporter